MLDPVLNRSLLSGESTMRITRFPLLIVLVAMLLTPALALAAKFAKKYQVTGTVAAISDTMITVQKKDGEKWEIDRDANTKVTGDLKVGSKVTIEYTMTASDVEVKSDKAKSK
jgi:hypothetical protein